MGGNFHDLYANHENNPLYGTMYSTVYVTVPGKGNPGTCKAVNILIRKVHFVFTDNIQKFDGPSASWRSRPIELLL